MPASPSRLSYLENRIQELEQTEEKLRKENNNLKRQLSTLTYQIENKDDLQFENLFDLEVIQRLQDQFAAATGVASIITTPSGTPITKPSNFRRLCKDIIRKTEKGRQNCFYSDAVIGTLNLQGPTIQRCLSGGLWDSGAGIAVGEKHLANWLMGQVRDANQTDEQIRLYAKEIGADEEETVKAFYEVPSMSREQYERIAEFLFSLANQLSLLAVQNVRQAGIIKNLELSEQKLRQSETHYRTLIETIPDLIWVKDPEGRYIYCNHVFEHFFGATEAEIRGKTDYDFVDKQQADFFRKHDLNAIARNTPCKNEETLTFADDGYRGHFETLKTPLLDSDGNLIGVLGISRDISDRLKVEKEKEILQEKLAHSQKMDAIGQLAGGIAHDFNNMLSGIKGATELLELVVQDNPKAEKYLEIIHTATDRTTSLIKKLLAFGRKGKQISSPVNLHTVLRDTLTILKSSIDKRITIETQFNAKQIKVTGDPAQLQNSFLNLFINARDAMPDGGVLFISTSNIDLNNPSPTKHDPLKKGTYLVISIQDSGHGIPEDIQPNIFEPFFTTKDTGKGTGLGLAAVYGTIKDHHGDINVTSTPGLGTIFTILLPIAASEKYTLTSRNEEHVVQGKGTILLVDDEDIIRTTGTLLLEEIGYQILLAENGEQAVNMYRELMDTIDLVILDVVMPVMDGRDAYRQLRATNPDIPIIISSGFAKDISMSEILADGRTSFIMKPFNFAELSKLVADYIGKEDNETK
ncbi:PocR ligand-binding domain-containing protein [Desulfogranum japonicum]|uniref:PocR ligand-binding domain-containing protein n=1 Tax=Desulfogranum japonicum TaxID=231447 RepID=UPI0003F4F72A|nr:PocR ligand-binding domain-containing protein [Desulfogranum japonicum]